MLDGNILILVHPSSGDNKFYKVRGDKSVFFYWIHLVMGQMVKSQSAIF